MTKSQDSNSSSVYRIKISGLLEESWSDWFDGMTIDFCVKDGEKPITTLTGFVPDQSALFGVLNKIRDLGLRLLSIEQVTNDDGALNE